MNKQPEITTATRNNLLNAFWKLYGSKEISEIRIKDLTDIAGCHRATFYQYFTDIYDLLHQEEESLIKNLESMKKTIDSTNSNEDILRQITEFYIQNGNRLSLLIGPGGDSKFVEKIKTTFYKDFISNEKLKDDPNVSIVFEFGINGLLMAFNRWYKIKDKVDTESFIKIVRSIIYKGIPDTLKSLSK